MTRSALSPSADDGLSLALRQLHAAESARPADPELWLACALEAARAGALQVCERACAELGSAPVVAPAKAGRGAPVAARALAGQGASAGAVASAQLLRLLANAGLQAARNRDWGRAERWGLLIEQHGGQAGLQPPESQFLVALVREQAGDRQRALAAIVTAVAGRRVSIERCLAWSGELCHHRQLALAACLMEQAIADHGEQTVLLAHQADLLGELGRSREARRCWSVVRARQPDQTEARLLFAVGRSAGGSR